MQLGEQPFQFKKKHSTLIINEDIVPNISSKITAAAAFTRVVPSKVQT
jgi:hypothetical protein